jgi:hypothetical protein
VVLAALLLGLAAFLAGTVFCAVRGVGLWRQAKRTGSAFSDEMALFEERSARTERLLEDADRANRDLQVAFERLQASRARLQVLTDSLARAQRSVRWLRAFLPVR